MEHVILYGIGEYYNKHKNLLPANIKVIAYGDSEEQNATSKTGKLLNGLPVLIPSEIEKIEFDKIYICTDFNVGNLIYQYLGNFNIPGSRIRFLNRIDAVDGKWEYEIQDDRSIISTIGQIKIIEKNYTDFEIVADVFAENSYNIGIINKESVVIDMGMNIGAATLYFAGKESVGKVYGFEPFPDTYQQALKNISINNESIRNKIHPFNIAIFDKEEEREVSIVTEQMGWRDIFSHVEGKQNIKIHCYKASEVVEKIINENPEKNIIMKIDTEGSEFAIFDSLAQTDVLEKISAIVMEYHDDPKIIVNLLKKYSYSYAITGKKYFGKIYAFNINK